MRNISFPLGSFQILSEFVSQLYGGKSKLQWCKLFHIFTMNCLFQLAKRENVFLSFLNERIDIIISMWPLTDELSNQAKIYSFQLPKTKFGSRTQSMRKLWTLTMAAENTVSLVALVRCSDCNWFYLSLLLLLQKRCNSKMTHCKRKSWTYKSNIKRKWKNWRRKIAIWGSNFW